MGDTACKRLERHSSTEPIGTRSGTTCSGRSQSCQLARCAGDHRCEPGTSTVQECPGRVWSER